MMVISRREGSEIRVGNVTISILRTGRFQTRIGIDAPKEVKIGWEKDSKQKEQRDSRSNPRREGRRILPDRSQRRFRSA